MDVIAILQTLKGKVLDATHFDMLKHAYELQDQNLKQLKTNNDVYGLPPRNKGRIGSCGKEGRACSRISGI